MNSGAPRAIQAATRLRRARADAAPSAERWRVSGHVVYDAKGLVRQQYEPYFMIYEDVVAAAGRAPSIPIP